MKNILVYRESLLPISETFIRNQVNELTRYKAVYGGIRRVQPSLPLDRDDAVLTHVTGWRAKLTVSLFERFHWAPAFYKRVRAMDVRLIHAHFAPDGAGVVPLAQALKVPLIVTLHGYDVTFNGALHRDFRTLWQYATRFLCVSEFIRQRAIAAGFPEEKLMVHYIGVDPNKFGPLTSEDLNSRRSGVLFVGRLVEKKGCAYLIRAMQQVQQVVPDALLTVIGDGPLRGALEAQAATLNVRCEFLGAQDQVSIRKQMQRAALFCGPSVAAADGDSEGFGIVFIEAQAVGTPVVSFRHGGIPEAVNDGVTGRLAPEGDVQALVADLLFYLQNEEARRTAGVAARQMVVERYDLARQTGLLEDVYDSVLRAETSH